MNVVLGQAPAMDINSENDLAGAVVIGTAIDWSSRPITLSTSDPTEFNAVQVRVERSAGQNGEVPLFFGRLLGRQNVLTYAVDPETGTPSPVRMRPRSPLVAGIDWRF